MNRDILATIDDAVESRCACNCGRKLNPDGPSQWYATPECQQRYLERQTADPGDVYDRPDAAYAYVGGDHLDVPLSGAADTAPVPVSEWLERHMADLEPRSLTVGRFQRMASEMASSEDARRYWLNDRIDATSPTDGTATPRGQQATRVWIGGQEVTDYIRSVDLNPIHITLDNQDAVFTPAPVGGDVGNLTDWREQLGGLRRASLSLDGFFDPSMSADYFGREHPDGWADAVTEDPGVRVGELAHERVARLVREAGLDLTGWQADILRRVYDPPTRFIASPSLAEQAQARGLNVIASDAVPEGQIMAVDQRMFHDWARRCIEEPIIFSPNPSADYFRDDVMAFRATMRYRMLPELVTLGFDGSHDGDHAVRSMLMYGNFSILDEIHKWWHERSRRRPRSWTAPRNNPRITALRRSYRQRVLARRRRNR